MLPLELQNIKATDVIEVIAEDCLNVNNNIDDYFKVIIWVENGSYLKYRVTDKDDNRNLFQIPSTMAKHAEALYLIVKEFNPTQNPFERAELTFEKQSQEWQMQTHYTY
jgi:hypothetical protein